MLNFHNLELEKIPNKELLRLCQECGLNIRKLQRQFAVFLIEVNKRGVHRQWGFHSVGEFASKLAGMGPEVVDRILRLAEKLKDMPNLMALLLECGWAKLEIIAGIAKPETQDFWVEKVKIMSFAVLQRFVQEIRNQEILKTIEQAKGSDVKEIARAQESVTAGEDAFAQQNIFKPESNVPQQQAQIESFVNGTSKTEQNFQKASITIFVRPEIEGKLRLFKLKLEKAQKKVLNWEDVMEEFLKIAERNSTSKTQDFNTHKQAQVKQIPANGNKKVIQRIKVEISRYIPNKIQRQIEEQYKEMCGYPGCNRPAENRHHTKRFSLEIKKWHSDRNTNVHDSKSIVSLCKIHHQFAHHGLIQNEEMQPHNAQTGAANWKLQLLADESAPKFKIDQLVQKFRLNSS